MADVFEGILGQPQVREFLRSTIEHNRASHAYLFTGPAGSNKTAAAYAFAQASCARRRAAARARNADA